MSAGPITHSDVVVAAASPNEQAVVEAAISLVSLRPRFANAILIDTKTVELRRRAITASPGTAVVLYASAPTMAVVGTATLIEVVALRPHTACRRYRHTLSLSWLESFNTSTA
jgi:hypothetical protein